MAQLNPSRPACTALNTGLYAELDLLQTLERGLSKAYTLFHSVDWSRGTGTEEQHGEIDIVVINQAGDLVLIEVKSGGVDFLPEGIFKTYAQRVSNVTAQIGLQYGALRDRLNTAGLSVNVNHLLVLPNLKVQTETVQWPRERIVDADSLGSIVSRITDLLGPGRMNEDCLGRVVAFFENRFRVAPDVSALAGHLQKTATRLSSGLAVWVPRIEVPSGLLRIIGTAGSGKTQLALRLLREADAAGQKAAYICFNRALGDQMARVCPVRTCAETFHEFALRTVRGVGEVVDFTLPTAFDTLSQRCTQVLMQRAPDLDLIVLDEMQDMQAEWVQALLSRLKFSGKAVLLEDPDQQLYKDREAFDIADAVTIRSYENFRTPRVLVKLINLLRLTATDIEACATHIGELPAPFIYESSQRIALRTTQAIERCLALGFSLDDIAIVSMRGRERSELQALDQLGPWALRRFTGCFDDNNRPIWTEGDLLLESVRRFKGQSAPAVVLTECDWTALDPMNRRLLFVGLTRAQVHMEWVISSDTAQMLEKALEAGGPPKAGQT